MAKKILILALAIVMATSFAVTASARGALVKDLADNLVQFAEIGNADEEDWLQNSGGENAAFEDGLWREKRIQDYDAVDIKAMNLSDGDYIVVVDVFAFTPTMFTIQTGGSPYGPIIASADGVTSHTFEYAVSVDDGKWQVTLDNGTETSQERIRIQTGQDAPIDDFCIKSIRIYEAGGGGGGAAPADGGGAGATDGGADKDKQPDSGVGDVAVASAIALVAAGAVIFSRKKK
ncbi:MAG: hypothetical protein FWE60_00660 [Oscillospiraceae bacterium]|nr:hypothetical protein [Oscillospiraceae bacterium]